MFGRRNTKPPGASAASANPSTQVPVVHARAVPLTGPERLAAELGEPCAFVVIHDTIHFHPDRTLGGFGVLGMLEATPTREPGLYLLAPDRHSWRRAYEWDDLPVGGWVGVTAWEGTRLPVDVQRATPALVVARWLSPASWQPVAPGEWGYTGGPSALQLWAAQKEQQMIERNLRGMR